MSKFKIGTKGVVSLVLFTLLVGGLLFHQLMVDQLIRYAIHQKSNREFGQELSYSNFELHDGHLLIRDVVWVDTTGHEEGGYRFEADQMHVDFKLDLWKRTVDQDVTITRPKLTVARKHRGALPAFPFTPHKTDLLTISSRLFLSDGVVELKNQVSGSSSLQRCFVDFNGEIVEQLKGNLQITFDGLPGQKKSIQMALEAAKFRGTADILVEGIECREMARATQFFVGEGVQAWEVSEGVAQGRLIASYKEGTRPNLDGELHLRNLQFGHTALDMQTMIGEARLQLFDPNATGSTANSPTPLGQLEILREGSLVFYRDAKPHWEVQHLSGGLYLDAKEASQIRVEGICLHNNQPSRLKIEGEALLLGVENPFADFQVTLHSPYQDDVGMRFRVEREGIEQRSLLLECEGIGRAEFDALSNLLPADSPLRKQFFFSRGQFDGRLQVLVKNNVISEVSLSRLRADDLQIELPGLGLELCCDKIFGDISADLHADSIFDAIASDLNVVNGRVSLKGASGKLWKVDDIDAELRIDDGVIEKSSATALFAGLRGEIALNWRSDEEIVHLDFSGSTYDLMPFLSEELQAKLERGLGEDHLQIVAGVSRKFGALELAGALNVGDSETIHFGVDIEQAARGLWKSWGQDSKEAEELRELSQLTVAALSPASVKPSLPLLQSWLEDEFGIYGLVFRDGWFFAENLPLHRYVEPLIFKDQRVSLTGHGSFKGDFVNQRFRVRYAVDKLVLETPYYRMEAPLVGDHAAIRANEENVPTQYIDFEKGNKLGFVPIKHGRYFDKKFGITFEDIDTRLVINNRKMHLTQFQSLADDVYFAGRIDVDFLEPDQEGLNVEFRTSEISGTVSQVQDFCLHFDNLIPQKLPLKGRVLSPDQGGYLRLELRPEKNHIELYLLADLSGGEMELEDGALALQDLSCKLDYSLRDNALVLSELHGQVTVGDKDPDSYLLTSPEIRVLNFPQHLIEFDVRLEDDTRDLVRIQGTGRSLEDPKLGQIVSLEFSHDETYLGEIRPNIDSFVLKDWVQVVSFHAEPLLRLSSAVDDLIRVSKTGWLKRSSREFAALKDYDLDGELRVKVYFDPETKQYQFSASSDDLSVNGREFENVFLNGKKQGEKWSLEQLQIDEVSIAADILRVEDGWKLNFLGLRHGDALLVGMEGHFISSEGLMKSKLNLLELDLAKADNLPMPEAWLEVLSPQGKLRASGEIQVSADSDQGPQVQAQLKASFRDLELANIEFEDRNEIPFTMSSLNTIFVGGLDLTVKNTERDPNGIRLRLDGLYLDLDKEEVTASGLRFAFPHDQLPWLAQSLQGTWPNDFGNDMAETLSTLKKDGDFSGLFDLKVSSTYFSVNLELDDGDYYFGENKHQLKDFSLLYDPYELSFRSLYKIKDKYHWISGLAPSEQLSSGRIFVGVADCKEALENGDQQSPLTVHYEIDEVEGLRIQRAEGDFQGLSFNLNRREDSQQVNHLVMTGQLAVNGAEASELFDQEIQEAISKWQIGSGYEFSGEFSLDKAKPGAVAFEGILVGKDIELKDYEFNTLYAQVDYQASKLAVSDFKILDPSGQLHIDEFHAWKGEESPWELHCPVLLVQDFRPSLLRSPGQHPQKPKPFTVTRLELQNLNGRAADSSSLTGEGNFQFTNPKKKNIRNTLLVIPQDILSRIGLDPDVMTPVGGTVEYTVQDGRVYVDKMKNVYSEGRLSKFYLPSSAYRSSMDFDGNLDLRVRMKQYNLIFKIAELFTITVGGKIDSPSYTLQKQSAARSGAQVEKVEIRDGKEVTSEG